MNVLYSTVRYENSADTNNRPHCLGTGDKLPHGLLTPVVQCREKPRINSHIENSTPITADEAIGFRNVVTGPLEQNPQEKTGKGKSFAAPCLTPGSLSQSLLHQKPKVF